MKRLLILTALALSAPAAMAGTATFGLFPHYGKCGSCSACPGPWNAFSPTGCCAVENANGCTLYPCGYHGNPYIAGGFPIGGGGGHHCGPFGCGLFGHGGHHGYGWNAGMPFPCGAVNAWHGMPGMGGCADPFGGCGTAYKPTLKDKLAGLFHHHGATSAPPEHLWDYFGGKFGGKFHGGFDGFGGFAGETVVGGGCPGCDAPLAAPLQAPTIAPATPAPPSAPTTAPVLYQPAVMQPVSYQVPAAYYPMPTYGYGYGYGYYPAYGYGYGYGYPMGW